MYSATLLAFSVVFLWFTETEGNCRQIIVWPTLIYFLNRIFIYIFFKCIFLKLLLVFHYINCMTCMLLEFSKVNFKYLTFKTNVTYGPTDIFYINEESSPYLKGNQIFHIDRIISNNSQLHLDVYEIKLTLPFYNYLP